MCSDLRSHSYTLCNYFFEMYCKHNKSIQRIKSVLPISRQLTIKCGTVHCHSLSKKMSSAVTVQPEVLEMEPHPDPASTPVPQLFNSKNIECIVERVKNSKTSVISYSLKPYSVKLGFQAAYKLLTILIKDNKSQNQETLYFFVKTMPEVSTCADYMREKGVFEVETTFFKKVVPVLLDGYQGPPWAAKCLLIKNDVLVFEELRLEGYVPRGRIFDEEYITSGLSALASMHASSLIAETRLGKPLNIFWSEAFVETGFTKIGKCYSWYKAGLKVAVAVAKKLGKNSSKISEAGELLYDAIVPSRTQRNVVSHGDIWINNMMIDDSTPPRCLLVDFQQVRYCPPAHDVMQFLYLCTDREFRRQKEKRMVQYYANMLKKYVSTSDLKIEPPTWEELSRGVEEQRLGSLVTSVLYLPTILLEGEVLKQIFSDPGAYAKYAYKDRTDVVLKNMKLDEHYRRRIEEAVSELVDLSEELDELPRPS